MTTKNNLKNSVNCLSCGSKNLLEQPIHEYAEMVFCHHCHNLLNEWG